MKTEAMHKAMLTVLLGCWIPLGILAQETDLLSLLEEEETTELVTHAFKSTRVINGHSMEMLGSGALDFRILHRFGKINQGVYQMFGLDQASMRLGLDYAVLPSLTLGAGRSTAKKEIDGFIKYRLIGQSTGKRNMPVSLIWVSGVTVNGLKEPFDRPEIPVTFLRRLGYYHELIIGRKFGERLSLQLSPTLVHRNIVDNELVPNELFAVGFGGRFKLSSRVAFLWDYGYLINRVPPDLYSHPLSLGFDIETGGHVFQLHFSNAAGMNERAYLSDRNGNWFRGDIQFGFNLSRIFQISE
ncbi:MAG: DUF5777 family beta-barrel protein [Bacteroidia bacterium]|nr:DUF5777 family beta-barrel protein [Bacteroidia bacterium]